jgi:hypothetical protein
MVYALRSYSIARHGLLLATPPLLGAARLIAAARRKAVVRVCSRHRPEAPRTDNRRCILTLLPALEPRFTFRGADVVEVLDKLLCADLVRASEEI